MQIDQTNIIVKTKTEIKSNKLQDFIVQKTNQ